LCKNEANVMFVGCIHKDFKAYADRLNQADAAVMSARLTQVDLLNEGIEEIIGAIVETEKTSPVWTQQIVPKIGVFDQLVPVCKSLNLFPWIEDAKRIRKRVLEDIYGVHPMALSCLLKLSSEIGSDARSAFSFFSGDVGKEAGSYAAFIESADIIAAGGQLNLYTVDRLFAFFEKELSPKSHDLRDRQRRCVNGYYASLDALLKASSQELFDAEQGPRVLLLKMVLLYDLCSVPATVENIQFGRYCLSAAEKNAVKAGLDDLVKKGALFFRRQSKTYELAVSTGEDCYEMIEQYIAVPENAPDVLRAMQIEGRAELLQDAKGYNLPFSEDKKYKIHLALARDLGTDYWESLLSQWITYNGGNQGYDVIVVHVLCEEEPDIAQARAAVASIPSPHIAVAVPHEPLPFMDTLLRARACRHYLEGGHGSQLAVQTESRFRDLLESGQDGYATQIQRYMRDLLEGENACWYTEAGRVLVDRPKQAHKPADMLCEQLYTRRCRIKHPDLNWCHDTKWRTGKNIALKQAVNHLLDADRVFIDNGNPDNHGEKRYLEKVLLKGAGALRKTGAEGQLTYFACDCDPDKISDDFPVLRELCLRLSRLPAGEALNLGGFLAEMRMPPFGAGGNALMLALAHVVRGYGERLTLYTDSTRADLCVIRSYENLAAIVGDPASKAVMGVRRVTQAQMAYVDLIAKAVDAPPLRHGEARTLNQVYDALQGWWNAIPPVARIPELYAPQEQKEIKAFVSAMTSGLCAGEDRFEFLLVRLPALYAGAAVDNAMTEEHAKRYAEAFAADVKRLADGRRRACTRLAEVVCPVFGAKGDMVACGRAITTWYERLNPGQRDPNRYTLEEAGHLLRRLESHGMDFETMLTCQLSADYGFSHMNEWTRLYIDEFAAKIKQAKEEIDNAKPLVPKPDIKKSVIEIQAAAPKPVEVPEGAKTLCYTTEDNDTETRVLREEAPLDLAGVLGGQPSCTVTMWAEDNEGNRSEQVVVKLESKERKYDIQVKKDLFDEEVTFKCPGDIGSFVAALKSLLKFGCDRKIISKAQREAVEAAINNQLTK